MSISSASEPDPSRETSQASCGARRGGRAASADEVSEASPPEGRIVENIDSVGVCDALSSWAADNAPLQTLLSLAFVNKGYAEAMARPARSRLATAVESGARLIGVEWPRRYRAVKERSDTLLERVVTQAELRGCINDDLTSLNALRSWLTKRLTAIGVRRRFAVATTSYLRSLRPSESVDRVVDPELQKLMFLGRCDCGHLPCKSPDLRLRERGDGRLSFTCSVRGRRTRTRSPGVNPKTYY